jgi:hypothetical protein
MARTRHDVATLTLGSDADAENDQWHPSWTRGGTLALYSSRCALHATRSVAHGACLEITFAGDHGVPDPPRAEVDR